MPTNFACPHVLYRIEDHKEQKSLPLNDANDWQCTGIFNFG